MLISTNAKETIIDILTEKLIKGPPAFHGRDFTDSFCGLIDTSVMERKRI